MQHRIAVALSAATLVTGVAVGAAPAASAAPNTCDSYSGQCPSVAPTQIHKPVAVVEGTRFSQDALPFTGGEFALLASAGALALGAGTTLVVVGRRRRGTVS